INFPCHNFLINSSICMPSLNCFVIPCYTVIHSFCHPNSLFFLIQKVQDVIRRPNPSNNDTMLELQHSQANLDVGECKVIQHLIDVTEVVAANPQSEKSLPRRNSKKVEPNYSDVNNDKEHSYDESCANKSASHSTLSFFSLLYRMFHIGMANGIQIYLAVVPNLFCEDLLMIFSHI
ncbi:Protein MID1-COMPLEMENTING ACTIVITY 1, partial [Camellia lanceoleosa]